MNKVIKTKTQSIDMFINGQFGNNVYAWKNLNDYYNSDFSGNVTIRYKSAGGGPRAFNVRPEDVNSIVNEWIKQGWKREKIFINQDLCQDGVLFNVELLENEFGLTVGYVDIASKKHKTSRELTYSYGLVAREWLKYYMCSSSHGDLQVLLEMYPNHVIEISIFDGCIGTIPNRNTIFWEVRNY